MTTVYLFLNDFLQILNNLIMCLPKQTGMSLTTCINLTKVSVFFNLILRSTKEIKKILRQICQLNGPKGDHRILRNTYVYILVEHT